MLLSIQKINILIHGKAYEYGYKFGTFIVENSWAILLLFIIVFIFKKLKNRKKE